MNSPPGIMQLCLYCHPDKVRNVLQLFTLAQTFVAQYSGLVNSIKLYMHITTSESVTITLQTAGGSTLGTATTFVTASDMIEFVFPAKPAIEASSN